MFLISIADVLAEINSAIFSYQFKFYQEFQTFSDQKGNNCLYIFIWNYKMCILIQVYLTRHTYSLMSLTRFCPL